QELGFGISFASSHTFALSSSLVDNGLQDGEVLQVLARRARLFSSRFCSSFVLVQSDGTVKGWGNWQACADMDFAQRRLTEVQQVAVGKNAMAALRVDGTDVVSWGDCESPESCGVQETDLQDVQETSLPPSTPSLRCGAMARCAPGAGPTMAGTARRRGTSWWMWFRWWHPSMPLQL
ncbi:unnamed protein product, partial [Effrenium voratum]